MKLIKPELNHHILDCSSKTSNNSGLFLIILMISRKSLHLLSIVKKHVNGITNGNISLVSDIFSMTSSGSSSVSVRSSLLEPL